MKAYVFTAGKMVERDIGEGRTHKFWEKKCIFNGEMDIIPHTGMYIVVKEGFSMERVASVCYDCISKTIEIQVETRDNLDEYPDVWKS